MSTVPADADAVDFLRYRLATPAVETHAARLIADLSEHFGQEAAHDALRKVLDASPKRERGRRAEHHPQRDRLWLLLYEHRRPQRQCLRAFCRALSAGRDGDGLSAKTIEVRLRKIIERDTLTLRKSASW